MLNAHDPLFLIGVLAVALAYSAVGHGGASGYLALLAFSTMAPKDASTLALFLNIGVSIIAFALFERAKHFEWSLAWPFLVGSIPLAFVGGSLKLSDSVHKWVLAGVLLYAAVTLLVRAPKPAKDIHPPIVPMQIGVGAAIGLLSGMVGVGGGIFLSPILLLMGWANAKKTAAVSALFILLNSAAGLLARPPSSLAIVQDYLPMLIIACVGAAAGAWSGARKMPDNAMRRTLGIAMLVAVAKSLVR